MPAEQALKIWVKVSSTIVINMDHIVKAIRMQNSLTEEGIMFSHALSSSTGGGNQWVGYASGTLADEAYA